MAVKTSIEIPVVLRKATITVGDRFVFDSDSACYSPKLFTGETYQVESVSQCKQKGKNLLLLGPVLSRRRQFIEFFRFSGHELINSGDFKRESTVPGQFLNTRNHTVEPLKFKHVYEQNKKL